MRNADGTLNGDLNDSSFALTSGSLRSFTTTSINENDTVYSLMPVVINQPPIIVSSIAQQSSPQIQNINTQNKRGEKLYKSADGTVKVLIGTNFTLKLKAQQPSVYNVENGVPIIKKPNEELGYVWRFNDELITSIDLTTLQSKVQVNGDTITITNVQPQQAGAYYCEISNDVGTTISETIDIEVLNPSVDSSFYTNLIENGDGQNGVSNWNASSTEFEVKQMSTLSSIDLQTTNKVNLFGYNVDTMHPRPYQLNTDVVRNLDYNKFIKGGTYFSRSEYKFDKSGGNFYVKAYQDIDVTDVADFITGGIYGVEGVRAVFGCYIGNAISRYVPTKEVALPSQTTLESSYVMKQPRVSLSNYLKAGPGFTVDKAYVTIEEYDNETRLVSSVLQSDGTISTEPRVVTLEDPWGKRLSNYRGRAYYTGGGIADYSYGTTPNPSNGQVSQWAVDLTNRTPDNVDEHLFVADELQPRSQRFTHGQYLEYNRIVLERLNPKTTKIRITLNFATRDWRMFDTEDCELGSDAIFENIGWQTAYLKNKLKASDSQNDNLWYIAKSNPDFADLSITEQRPLAPSPRVAITGLALTLIPIQPQNMSTTNYYVENSLTQNDNQSTIVAKGYKRR